MEKSFSPYIASERVLKEFSFRAIALGLLLGFFFAIGNAYLGLKVGMTVSASIPASILSMAIFKTLFRKNKATILEHNIVQTVSTVGEGLAAGAIFTIPALMFLGETPSIFRIFLLCSLGGILGILFMIPMRRFIIIKEHKTLPFPEGTACAEILKAGEETGSSALMALCGFLMGAIYKVISSIVNFFPESPQWTFERFHRAVFSIDASPALMGVGYIIGPRISSLLFAGGITAWWILIPLIQLFGGNVTIFPATASVDTLSSNQIWSYYIRYIGAGAVAIGGLFSMVKIGPMIFQTMRVGISELFSTFKSRAHIPRVDRDISLSYLILGSVAIILVLWLSPGMPMNFFTILLLTVLSFFFTAVTSLTVGLVGSSSNPVSGMTITTLLLTCLIFVSLGWTERIYLISALTMSCVACVAICMAATTSQDLKTGFLLGATPSSQQIAEIIGVIIPSLALGATIYLLNQAFHIGSEIMPAPQASMLAMVAEAVIAKNIPYTLVFVGILLGVVLQILRIPVLAFALGLYLPLSLSIATMAGGLVALVLKQERFAESIREKAQLIAAGLIGGDASIGVVIAILAILGILSPDQGALLPKEATLIFFGLLGALFIYFAIRSDKKKTKSVKKTR